MSSWSADQMSQANRRRPVPCHKGGSSECSPVTTLGACCFLSETAGARGFFSKGLAKLASLRFGLVQQARWRWKERCGAHKFHGVRTRRNSNTRLAGMVERSPLLSPKSNIPTQQGIEELPGHAAVQGEGPKGRGLKQRHSLQNDRRLETSRAEKKACNFLPSLAKVSQLKHQKCRARSFALCLEWLECVASHTIYFRRWQKTHHMPRSCGTGTRRNARPGTKPCRLLLNDVKDKKKADARCFKSEM